MLIRVIDLNSSPKGTKFKIKVKNTTLMDDYSKVGDVVYSSGSEGGLSDVTFRVEGGRDWFYLANSTVLEELK